jgi:hypothetical protein
MRKPDRYDLIDMPFRVGAVGLMSYYDVPWWACFTVMSLITTADFMTDIGRDLRSVRQEDIAKAEGA